MPETTVIRGVSTIDTDVKINNVSLNYVSDIGDLGGTPSELDITAMKDHMKITVPGIQDTKAYEVTYWYENSGATSDYRRLKAIQDAGTPVEVSVILPDGTTFASTAYVSTYVSGAKTNEALSAKAILNLQEDWTVTNPSASV